MSRARSERFVLADGADAVGQACAWIARDPLAILRCGVAVAQTGQVPPPAVTEAARQAVPGLASCAPAHLRELVEQSLVGKHVHASLQWLHDAGVTALLLPEIEATVDFSQEAGRRHKDVWEHTKQVCRQAVPRPAVRWAALLHDIGKVPTRTFTPDGKVHFHGHAEVGARMFGPIARRFAFERPFRHKVRFLIKHHLRANQYAPSWTDSAVRRFDREMGEHLDDLLDLSRADITSKRPGRRPMLLKQISSLAARIEALRAQDARVPPLPKGLGNDITERFGIPPSKRIGDLKKAMEAAVEAGTLEPGRDSGYYLDWLEKSGLV